MMTIEKSDLQWHNLLRPSMSHIDNWSVAGDLLRIAKTVKPAVDSDGHVK